jgi:hypothetical protein
MSEYVPSVGGPEKLERYKLSNDGSVLIWDRDSHSQAPVTNPFDPLACYAGCLVLYGGELLLQGERIVTVFRE